MILEYYWILIFQVDMVHPGEKQGNRGHLIQISNKSSFLVIQYKKATVSRDFRPLFYLVKTLLNVPLVNKRHFYQLCRVF